MTQRILQVEVDARDVIRLVRAGERAIDRAIGLAADELKDAAGEESRSASSRVASSWEVEDAGGLDRRVVSDVFFAHFLAGGTEAHGPSRARHLVFEVNGNTVFASFVSGIKPNPFDERAISTVESRADSIIECALSEEAF